MRRAIEPMITYGTNPGHGDPDRRARSRTRQGDAAFARALAYMGLTPGQPIKDQPVNVVFLGSCTNGAPVRPAQRRAAAARPAHRRGRAACWSCPARSRSSAQAEAEGLDRVFLDAGAEWRESGCSMCLGMNGDLVARGEYAVSTSNRNFEGRQGAGARTLLASPLTAAASAVRGRVTDPRELHVRRGASRCNRFTTLTLAHRGAAGHQHRHRPDHPGALPHHHHARRASASSCSPTGATTQRAQPRPDFALNRPDAAGCQVLVAGATSAAAPRASTRPGRCSTTASAPWSAPRSPTSSATTR